MYRTSRCFAAFPVRQQTRARSHNLLARYAAPSTEELAAKAGSDLERYETVATNPVASSFQDVPPPEQENAGIRTARTLPAMQPLHEPDVGAKPKRDWRETRAPLVVQGIKIPSRPIAPGEEGEREGRTRLTSDCCMSGCVHCVYTIYADDQQEYDDALNKALAAVKSAGIPKSEWPVEVAERDDGGGTDVVKKTVQDVDPTLSAFLA